MRLAESGHGSALLRLRRALPLVAYGRPTLLAFLRKRAPLHGSTPRLKVTNIFQTRDADGLMCQFVLDGAEAANRLYVAPIEQLTFGRTHPLTREIATLAQRRAARPNG